MRISGGLAMSNTLANPRVKISIPLYNPALKMRLIKARPTRCDPPYTECSRHGCDGIHQRVLYSCVSASNEGLMVLVRNPIRCRGRSSSKSPSKTMLRNPSPNTPFDQGSTYPVKNQVPHQALPVSKQGDLGCFRLRQRRQVEDQSHPGQGRATQSQGPARTYTQSVSSISPT